MHLIIKRSSWSENDWRGTEYYNDPDVAVELKLGELEDFPRFKIAEIGPDWVRVQYSDGQSASHGTFDKECKLSGSDPLKYDKEKVLHMGQCVTVSFSDRFSESSYGSDISLYLSDKMVAKKSWDHIIVGLFRMEDTRVKIDREYIAVGKKLRDSYREMTGEDIEWLDFAPILITDDMVRFQSAFRGYTDLTYQTTHDEWLEKPDTRSYDLFMKKNIVSLSLSDANNRLINLKVDAELWKDRQDPKYRELLIEQIHEQLPDFDTTKILD